jgi:hypothetical protein
LAEDSLIRSIETALAAYPAATSRSQNEAFLGAHGQGWNSLLRKQERPQNARMGNFACSDDSARLRVIPAGLGSSYCSKATRRERSRTSNYQVRFDGMYLDPVVIGSKFYRIE